MSEVAVRADGLGKRYRVGRRERYETLRDTVAGAGSALFRAMRRPRAARRLPASLESEDDLLWALEDVSFEIFRGDVVGIVGRNGAGKSTLLRVLSRITEPTAGQVEIHGRVGSLLEVGTGFHPELTGRENVFLNGAILGMRRAEIRRKFDEIVAFAEVERFIDTPVKRYSTGMYMRLAFAVAAHLEPEILIVDEVLAVGDAQFQKKCLGKMGAVARQGRTVLFVSHQMNQIRRLCERCLWLDRGHLRGCGAVHDVLGLYEASFTTPSSTGRSGVDAGATRFLDWSVVDSPPDRANVLTTMGSCAIRFTLHAGRRIRRGVHGIALLSNAGQNLWGTAEYDIDLAPGIHEFIHTLPHLVLQPGAYRWQVSLSDADGLIDLWDCLPDLVIATQPVTHRIDAYAGILNLPSTFGVRRPASPVQTGEAVVVR
jgi:lipopolysaccharide transport system ATP-binding protein